MRLLAALAPLLVLLAFWAVLAGGCGVIGGGENATPTPTSTPTLTPTATPSPSPTPRPELQTASFEINQGAYAVVRVWGVAASAVATLEGVAHELLPRDGGFWGVIGVAADQAIGSYTISVSLRDGAGSSVATLDAPFIIDSAGYPVETILLTPDESALLDPTLSQQEAATRERVYSTFTPERLWAGPFALPSAARISSPYGIGRSYNGAPVSSFHHGTDFAADEGAPVAASNSGRVAFAGPLPIRGNSVIIDHGAGVFSSYHHLLEMSVAVGQAVAKGDLVGKVGATGLATGPHLHWEIVVNGVNVDPVLWTYEEIGP